MMIDHGYGIIGDNKRKKEIILEAQPLIGNDKRASEK